MRTLSRADEAEFLKGYDSVRSSSGQGRSARREQTREPLTSAFQDSSGGVFADYTAAQTGVIAGRALAPELAPVRAVLKLQAFWRLSDEQMLAICGIPAEEGGGFPQSIAKHFRLVDVRARLRSLIAIRARLSALYGGDAERERRWLTTPWERSGNQAPLSLLTSSQVGAVFELEDQVRELAGG